MHPTNLVGPSGSKQGQGVNPISPCWWKDDGPKELGWNGPNQHKKKVKLNHHCWTRTNHYPNRHPIPPNLLELKKPPRWLKLELLLRLPRLHAEVFEKVWNVAIAMEECMLIVSFSTISKVWSSSKTIQGVHQNFLIFNENIGNIKLINKFLNSIGIFFNGFKWGFFL